MSSATAVAERATRLDNGKRGLTDFKLTYRLTLMRWLTGLWLQT